MQGVTGEQLQPCNSDPVRDAGTQTAAGDPPGMEDNEKTELFWRKRSMAAEGCLQIPTSVLSRRSFPTPRATQSLPNGRLFALPALASRGRQNAVGGLRAALAETVRTSPTSYRASTSNR